MNRERQKMSARPLTEPALCRLPPDTAQRAEILELHVGALGRGEAGYLDPVSGLFVLSARFLADRGYCCERGCRHCPYVVDAP
ncbi:MAG: DUF5522 domain-containing protein [Actinomycetes bacterium]